MGDETEDERYYLSIIMSIDDGSLNGNSDLLFQNPHS